MKYTIIKTDTGEILEREDIDGQKCWIPIDPANSDYQAYLNKDKPKEAPNV